MAGLCLSRHTYPPSAGQHLRVTLSRMLKKQRDLKREELVQLVTAPVLRQLNENMAAVLEVLGEVRESVEAVARQMARELKNRGTEEKKDQQGRALRVSPAPMRSLQ